MKTKPTVSSYRKGTIWAKFVFTFYKKKEALKVTIPHSVTAMFGQVQMTPWNCIPSDLEAGNILSCHVLFISFMSSILFVVSIQLFFTDAVETISSSSFSLASLFSPLLPVCQDFTMTFTYSVFLHLPLLGFHIQLFQCRLRPGLFGPCYWKGIWKK